MAQVYAAVTHGAAGFARQVAVKRIHDHLSGNQEFVAMFVEEARVTAALAHPNIVQIHDFDRDSSGAYFLVMEWVEGLNLLDWCETYREHGEHTPWHLVAAIGIEVLKGLGAAHNHRDGEGRAVPVFHRDVTPQNILLGLNGIIKLTDFGLARAMDRSRMTQPEMVKGKLSYLAPELTLGHDASVQSDIYGLGIVLWETLCGRKLFDGNGPLEILTRVKEGVVPPLQSFRPDVPEALRTVLKRALAKEPGMRFRSARAMVRALANILRMTPESTSAEVIAKSVHRAQLRSVEELRESQFEMEVELDEEPSIPLTQRKR